MLLLPVESQASYLHGVQHWGGCLPCYRQGPLPFKTTFAKEGLDFPGHLIIVPLTHAPTIATAAIADSAAPTYKEMSRFREALQAMVSSKTKRKLGERHLGDQPV